MKTTNVSNSESQISSLEMSTAVAKKGNPLKKEKWYGYLFILPMVLGFSIFLLGPIITAFGMSFTNWSLLNPAEFIGFDNYVRAFSEDPVFWKTVGNTLYFSAGLVPLNLVLAFGLALLLKKNLPGMGFFRTAIFTPVVTSLVVWAIVFKYIFATDHGLVNQILQLIGIDGPAWLYDMQLTMPVVILVSVLKNLGLNMVIFLAALHDVPKMYYEAATIDGASKWKMTTKITLPLISPSIFLALILTIIGSLKVFGQIYVMTGGGPGTSTYVLVYYIYQQAFKLYDFGYASAIAFILFLIIFALTLLQWQFRKRWVHYEQ